ncbi:MAG: F0F1 ATP synthase subunit B [Bacteroidales bacterium]|jgi:F-type H+-transporting ATPase subunit b|nr:F0F1 ATP synthase subunit B [Bacteroidales bacterium]
MDLLTPSSGLLFWMFISFAIVFGLLAKFGFPVIVKIVDERRNYIKQSLESAEEANYKLENIKQESESIIKEARDRQNSMIKQATDEGHNLVQNAKEQAIVEAQRQIADAAQKIEVEKQRAMEDIRVQVAELSVVIAEKVLRRQLDSPANQDALIARFLDEVETMKI